MVRIFHKYLSLIISIQLLLWTISGIYFAFNKIELVRGEQYIIKDKSSSIEINNFEQRMFRVFRNVFKYGDGFFLRDPETKKL